MVTVRDLIKKLADKNPDAIIVLAEPACGPLSLMGEWSIETVTFDNDWSVRMLADDENGGNAVWKTAIVLWPTN